MSLQSGLTLVDKQHVKKIITAAVKLYQRDHREEAIAFYSIVENKRKQLFNQYGAMQGDHAIDRALYEMPENLLNVIAANLDDEQFIWFRTVEGARWFTKTFKKFALTEI